MPDAILMLSARTISSLLLPIKGISLWRCSICFFNASISALAVGFWLSGSLGCGVGWVGGWYDGTASIPGSVCVGQVVVVGFEGGGLSLVCWASAAWAAACFALAFCCFLVFLRRLLRVLDWDAVVGWGVGVVWGMGWGTAAVCCLAVVLVAFWVWLRLVTFWVVGAGVGVFGVGGAVCLEVADWGRVMVVVAMALTISFLLGHLVLEAGCGPWQLVHLTLMACCCAFFCRHTSVSWPSPHSLHLGSSAEQVVARWPNLMQR